MWNFQVLDSIIFRVHSHGPVIMNSLDVCVPFLLGPKSFSKRATCGLIGVVKINVEVHYLGAGICL